MKKLLLICLLCLSLFACTKKDTVDHDAAVTCYLQSDAIGIMTQYSGQVPIKEITSTSTLFAYDFHILSQSDFNWEEEDFVTALKDVYAAQDVRLTYDPPLIIYELVFTPEGFQDAYASTTDLDFTKDLLEEIIKTPVANGAVCDSDPNVAQALFDENIAALKAFRITYDIPFDFDLFELTFGSDIRFTKVKNQFSEFNNHDVALVPVHIVNNSGATGMVNMFYYSIFSPDGIELDDVTVYFSSDENTLGYGSELRNGAEGDYVIPVLFTGDGEYVIEFDNYGTFVEVYLPIEKTGTTDSGSDSGTGSSETTQTVDAGDFTITFKNKVTENASLTFKITGAEDLEVTSIEVVKDGSIIKTVNIADELANSYITITTSGGKKTYDLCYNSYATFRTWYRHAADGSYDIVIYYNGTSYTYTMKVNNWYNH